MKRYIAAATILLSMAASAAAGSSTFCTLDQATSRILEAASIDLAEMPDQGTADATLIAAQNMVLGKMAEKPDEEIRITWSDVYTLRGIAHSLICSQATASFYQLNCAAAAVDAVGAGLTGSIAGKMLTTVRLTGPVGFMVGTVMTIHEESFQCDPSNVRMFTRGAADLVMYLPVCKYGAIGRGCVMLQDGLEAGASKAITGMFGEGSYEVAKATAVKLSETEAGKIVVKLALKPVKGAIKDGVVDGIVGTGEALNSLQQAAGDQDPFDMTGMMIGLP